MDRFIGSILIAIVANSNLLFGGFGFALRGGVLFLETLDAAGGVDELLLAGEERVAVRADFDAQHVPFYGAAGLPRVAAGAVHRYGMIVGVNSGFHSSPVVRVRSARFRQGRRIQPRR